MRSRLLGYAAGVDINYQIGPHLRLLAEKLEAVERGEIKRLAVMMPPRHGKSRMTSELFPSWYLGRNPDKQLLFTSYGQELADGFGRKVRNLVADPIHTAVFPECILADDSKASNRFATKAGGLYYAVGAGGAVTGRGADLLVIDDPVKGREEADSRLQRDRLWDWYTSVAYTRLMPGGAIVLVLTRWHQDDIAGRVFKGEEPWEVINLPAIAEDVDALKRAPGEPLWPERYDATALATIRQTIGERDWSALYQQRPSPVEGALFRRGWLHEAPKAPHGSIVAMGVDLAISTKEGADYTAIAVIARDEVGKLYVVDVVRERVDFPGALALIRNMAAKHNPKAIGIEQVQFQAAVIQSLMRDTTLPVKGIRPDKDKVTRATGLALRYEQGMVLHCGLPAWFEDELTNFPAVDHDDAVDALVYAYQTVMECRGKVTDALSMDQRHEFTAGDSYMGY